MARACPPPSAPSLQDETDDLWDAALGARAGDRLEELVALFDAYQSAMFPVGAPRPVEQLADDLIAHA